MPCFQHVERTRTQRLRKHDVIDPYIHRGRNDPGDLNRDLKAFCCGRIGRIGSELQRRKSILPRRIILIDGQLFDDGMRRIAQRFRFQINADPVRNLERVNIQ